MCRKGNSYALLVGIQTGIATMENSIEVPKKIKIRTTIQSSNSTSGYLSKENKNISWKTYLHFQNHCSRAKIQKNLSVH